MRMRMRGKIFGIVKSLVFGNRVFSLLWLCTHRLSLKGHFKSGPRAKSVFTLEVHGVTTQTPRVTTLAWLVNSWREEPIDSHQQRHVYMYGNGHEMWFLAIDILGLMLFLTTFLKPEWYLIETRAAHSRQTFLDPANHIFWVMTNGREDLRNLKKVFSRLLVKCQNYGVNQATLTLIWPYILGVSRWKENQNVWHVF